jgi:hypothetical protein
MNELVAFADENAKLRDENAKLTELLRTHGIAEASQSDCALLLHHFKQKDVTSYIVVDVMDPNIKQLRQKFLIDVAPMQGAFVINWHTGEQVLKQGPAQMVARLTRTGMFYWNHARFHSG